MFVVYVASVRVVIHCGWLRPLENDADKDSDEEVPASGSLPLPLGMFTLGLVVIVGGAELVG